MRIDLVDLRLFLNVVQTNSITSGAARSNLSVAAASVRIAAMENALGVRLFERRARGVRLLAAGEAVLGHAEAVVREVDGLAASVRPFATGERGIVRVLANTAAITQDLPAALPGYLSAYPGIDVDLKERASDEIALDVAGGRAEIGILADTADLSRLQTVGFRRDDLALAVPAGDRLASLKSVSLGQAADRRFVGLSPNVPLQRYVERSAGRAGLPLSLRVRVNSLDAVCALVRDGVGVAIVPSAVACKQGVRHLQLTDGWASRTLRIGVRDRATLSPPALRFVEHLESCVQLRL
ncbi:MAG: LysR family transcriptional regulator [Burkholderiales bacterium]